MAQASMMAAGPLSIVTIANGGGGSHAWQRLFEWPRLGDSDIAFAADTQAQRNLLASRLDAAVTRADRGVLLVAQGAGCFAAAWWARLSPTAYVSRVAGALLFDPFGQDESGTGDASRRFASPRIALPFPSIVIDGGGTGGDRSSAQVRAIAEDWGSQVVAGRHRIGGAAQPAGAWRQAQRMIERLTAAVVAHDIRTADKLRGGTG